MNKPICVAIEGVDCAGKGTMAKKVVSALEHTKELAGVPIHLVSFPDYSLLSGQMVRKYLNGDYPSKSGKAISRSDYVGIELTKDILFYAGLYSTNRQEYFYLNPIDENAIYVFDRYCFSNITHQLSKVWNEMKELELDNEKQVYLCREIGKRMFTNEPSVVAKPFYLTIDIETAMYRLKHRKNDKHVGVDIHENRKHLSKAIDFVSWLKTNKDQISPDLVFIDAKKDNGVKIICEHIMKEFEGRNKNV